MIQTFKTGQSLDKNLLDKLSSELSLMSSAGVLCEIHLRAVLCNTCLDHSAAQVYHRYPEEFVTRSACVSRPFSAFLPLAAVIAVVALGNRVQADAGDHHVG